MHRTAVCGVFALLAAATPALAGQVFIPVAGHHAANSGIAYRTAVWVTNLGQADTEVVARFVEEGADGTLPQPGLRGVSVAVPAGATVLLAGAAPADRSGMLEVSGGADLAVRARLEAVDWSGRALSATAMQAVSAATSLAAGEVVHLQGLGRQAGGEVTDLGLLNLADQAAVCQVSAFRADGSRIAPAATLGLPPLGSRAVEDAFGRMGEQRLAGGRFEVSCDQQFYAYAVGFAAGGPVGEAVTPSQGLSDNAVTGVLEPVEESAPAVPAAPSPDAAAVPAAELDGAQETAGTAVPERAAAPGGAVTLTVPGLFLHATNSNSFISYELGARPGIAYHRATVDFDLTIQDFNQILLFTGVTSLRRPNKNRKDRVLYYALQLVNRNRKTVLDLGVQDRLARTQGPWKSGHTYHLTFTYDLRGRKVKLDVFEGGKHIYAISGPALHFDLSSNANPLTVDFGQTGIGDGAYGPPIGWDYANLSVLLQP